jgi:hypothetical protein
MILCRRSLSYSQTYSQSPLPWPSSLFESVSIFFAYRMPSSWLCLQAARSAAPDDRHHYPPANAAATTTTCCRQAAAAATAVAVAGAPLLLSASSSLFVRPSLLLRILPLDDILVRMTTIDSSVSCPRTLRIVISIAKIILFCASHRSHIRCKASN